VLKLQNNLFLFSLLTLTFQSFAIKLFNSRYDLSSLILLLLLVCSFLNRNITLKNFGLYITLFFYQIIILIINFDNNYLHRYISAIGWLSLMYFLITGELKYTIKQKNIYRIIIFSSFIQAFYILFQFYFLDIIRPKGLFSEPSSAGLMLFATCFAYLASSLLKNHKYSILFLIFVLLGGFLTRSIHVFTNLIFFILILIYLRKHIGFKINKIFIIVLITLISTIFILNNQYILSRITFEELNLSQIIWIRGFEQALVSIKKSYIFGLGVGSTGLFEFETIFFDKLQNMKMYELNIFDSYSLFNRLIIELGFLITFIFLIYFWKRFKINFNINKIDENSRYHYFNKIFSFFLILGCLIKEPLYANSLLLVSLFLFFNKEINKNE